MSGRRSSARWNGTNQRDMSSWVRHPADLGTPIVMSGPFLSPTSDRAERPVASPAEKRNWVAAWTGLAIAAIWIAVTLISVYAPDLVTGTTQDHVPLAAILAWIWGVLASRNVAVAILRRRRSPGVADSARLLAIAVTTIWTICMILAVAGPEWVSGTSPTRIPISAIVAPIIAVVLTQLAIRLIKALDNETQQPAGPTEGGPSPQARWS